MAAELVGMTGGAGAAEENGVTSSDILKSGGLEANSATQIPEISCTCNNTMK